MNSTLGNIIISRTDSIGDVILTLPVAARLKQYFPSARIAFLGKAYTKPVIEACKYVDEFIEVSDFLKNDITIDGKKPDAILHVLPASGIAFRAKKMGIPLRIGTTNRLYHWATCNKLVRLSRKKSDLHEALLNLKLLQGFGINDHSTLAEIGNLFGLEKIKSLKNEFATLVQPGKYNLILHPKSQGSAREWGLPNFVSLIYLLDDPRFNIFISGTEKEKALLKPLFDAVGARVTDITGLMDLDQFIAFIQQCDGLIANSTGPLHIAAALGKDAMGIYPPIRPMHPGRWAPLGLHAKVFVLNKICNDCRKTNDCTCIRAIEPALIAGYAKTLLQ